MEQGYEQQELIVMVKENTPLNVVGQKQFIGYIENKNTIEVYEKIGEICSSTKVEIHPYNHHVVRAVKRWSSLF